MKLTMRATALGKRITLITAAFVLAVSTLTAAVPFILSQTVSAAPVPAAQTTQAVLQSDFQNAYTTWTYHSDTTETADASATASHEIVANPTPSAGDNGAVRLSSASGDRWNLASLQYSGTKLADVAALGFNLYTSAPGKAYINLDVDFNHTGLNGWQGRLVYIPSNVTANTWGSHEAVASNGSWQWSRMVTNAESAWPDGETVTNRSWDDIVAAFPEARITAIDDVAFGSLYLRADGVSTTYYDYVYLATSTQNIRYNFELPATAGIVNVDPYYVTSAYKGIGVDIKVDNLTDATDVAVQVDRTNGGPVVKTAKQSVLDALNTGTQKTVTAPIVIQSGTYNEDGSSSWNKPVASWDYTTLPTSVTVTITRSGGAPLVMTKALGENNGPFATRSEVMPLAPVDTQPPTFAITSPANSSVVGGTQTINAVVQDESGITKLLMTTPTKTYVWEEGKTNNTLTRNGDVFSVTVDTNTFSNGLTHIVLRGTDGAGNTRYWNNNAANRTHGFTVDNVAPVVTKLQLNNTTIAGQYQRNKNCDPINQLYWAGGSLNLTAVIEDDLSGVESASYSVRKLLDNGCTDTATYKSAPIALQKNNESPSNWNQLTSAVLDTKAEGLNGKYAIVLVTKDGVGNQTVKYIDLNIDNTNPAAPTGGQPSTTIVNPFYFTWNEVTDSGSPIVEYQYQTSTDPSETDGVLTNVQWVNWTSPDALQNFLSTPEIRSAGAPDGVWHWQVRAIDAAGNVGQWSQVWSTLIDTADPVVTLDVPTGPVGGATDAVEINGSVSDANLVEYTITITDGTDQTFAKTVGGAITPFPWDISLLTSGTYTVTLTAKDAAGKTTSTSQDVEIDNTPIAVITPNSDDGGGDGDGGTDDGTTDGGFTGPAFTPTTSDQLGVSDDNTNGTEGTSTNETLAAAVTNTDGNAFGLAWYWWLLLIAGGTAGLWWLIAAIRGRGAE